MMRICKDWHKVYDEMDWRESCESTCVMDLHVNIISDDEDSIVKPRSCARLTLLQN